MAGVGDGRFWITLPRATTLGTHNRGARAGRWWRERGEGLEVVEYGVGDRADRTVTVFFGPGQVQTYKKSLEFNGKKKLFFQGPGAGTVVRYSPANDSASYLTEVELTTGPKRYPLRVGNIQEGERLNAMKIPQHMRESLSQKEMRTLSVFMPLQTMLYQVRSMNNSFSKLHSRFS